MKNKEFSLREEYNKLSKKYDLPDFDKLNNEFELETIEREEFPLRQIRRRIVDRLVIFCKIIEEIIYPSGQNQLINHEIRSFSEEDRKQFVELHKKMMVYERQSLFLNISSSKEEEDAKYIFQLFSEMDDYKLVILEVVKKMQTAWKHDLPDEEQPYFG